MSLTRKAQCIRQAVNTAPLPRKFGIDAPTYDKEQFNATLSAKYQRLVETIKDLDARDKARDGVLHKHFIFTDIKNSAHGAKIIAGFLDANGFGLRMAKPNRKGGAVKLIEKPSVVGGCSGFAVLQALPMWGTPLTVTLKKAILTTFNARPENVHGELLRILILDSKFKEGIDLFDVKYVHLMEPPITSADEKQAIGRATRFCGQKGLTFRPGFGWPLHIYTYVTEVPSRPPFTQDTSESAQKIDAHELMLEASGLDLTLLKLTNTVAKMAIENAADRFLTADVHSGGAVNKDAVKNIRNIDSKLFTRCAGRKTHRFPYTRKAMSTVAQSLGLPIAKSAKRGKLCTLLQSNQSYLDALLLYKEPEKALRIYKADGIRAPPPSIATIATMEPSPVAIPPPEDPAAFQQWIRDTYSAWKWPPRTIVNGCLATTSGALGQRIDFTATQNFLQNYFTPASSFKGVLAWHSVGTGKTCMAVATTTRSWIAAGYTLLWVTRNALMSDVYKNIFGSVCDDRVIRHLESGGTVPVDKEAQRRLLGKGFIPPISYKMFQNLIEGKNDLGRRMAARSPGDPLRRVVLVLDEVHKLLDGDLGPAEDADIAVIQRALWDSYSRSGADAVRPLVMTATPISKSPGDLFTILNMLIPSAADRLMSFDSFRRSFTADDGGISAAGLSYYNSRARGLVSYLNRGSDPTTFAQPVLHMITVPLSERVAPRLRDLVATCTSDEAVELAVIPDCKGLQGSEKRDCTRRAKEAKALNKKALGGVTRRAGKCYTATKSMYVKDALRSQIGALSACFGQKPTEMLFPSRKDFLAALHREERAAPSAASSVAVRNE